MKKRHNYSLPPAVRTDWTPVCFIYPPVTPVSEALDQIIPRPYRPYKPGRYQSAFSLRVSRACAIALISELMTTAVLQCDDGYPPNGLGILDRGARSNTANPCVFHGLATIHTNAHFHFGPHDRRQIDSDFSAYYHLRAKRLASSRGSKLFTTLPDRPQLVRGGADAARELVHELAEFLVARYPGVYRATRRAGEIVAVEVLPVGVTHNLEAEDPIVVAAML